MTADGLYGGPAPVVSTAQTTVPQPGFVTYAPPGVALSGTDVTGPFAYAGVAGFPTGTVAPDTSYVLATSRYPNRCTSGRSVRSVAFGTGTQVFQVRFKQVGAATEFRLSVDGRKVTDPTQSAGAIRELPPA